MWNIALLLSFDSSTIMYGGSEGRLRRLGQIKKNLSAINYVYAIVGCLYTTGVGDFCSVAGILFVHSFHTTHSADSR